MGLEQLGRAPDNRESLSHRCCSPGRLLSRSDLAGPGDRRSVADPGRPEYRSGGGLDRFNRLGCVDPAARVDPTGPVLLVQQCRLGALSPLLLVS